MYYLSVKYKSFQFIQYLLTITNEKFIEEFEVTNEEDVDMHVEVINHDYVHNLTELKMMVSIAKHTEYNYIHFHFLD